MSDVVGTLAQKSEDGSHVKFETQIIKLVRPLLHKQKSKKQKSPKKQKSQKSKKSKKARTGGSHVKFEAQIKIISQFVSPLLHFAPKKATKQKSEDGWVSRKVRSTN